MSKTLATANIDNVLLTERGSAPSTPASGQWRVYAKSGGLFIVDDAGVETGPFGSGVTESFRLPVLPLTPNTTASLATGGTVWAIYVGKAAAAYTSCNISFQVTTAATSVTWAEVAVASGDLPTDHSAPVLTARGFTSIATEIVAAPATHQITVSLSGVTVGMGLWLVIGRSGGTTTAQVRGGTVQADSTALFRQFIPGTTTQPQSLSGTTMTLGTAGGVPFLVGRFS